MRKKAERLNISLPRAAVINTNEKSAHIAAPNNSEYKGYSYYLPVSVMSEDQNSEDGRIAVSIGEGFKVTLRKGDEQKELSAQEYKDLVDGTKTEDPSLI